ncbi:HlyD family secretion protein [Telmatobacter bradus]|uniref:HlyD family secretion protein n=1 Tax=Telmatobacter bradus TaxID=474953 RepID=UPI003B42BF93
MLEDARLSPTDRHEYRKDGAMVTATTSKDATKQMSPKNVPGDQKTREGQDPARVKTGTTNYFNVRDKVRRYLKPAIGTAILAIIALATYFIWQHYRAKGLGAGFASGNGRIEAVELDIAAKAPGRISEMYADEGDVVIAGQVVARMDTPVLHAQLRQAQAEEFQARNATNTAMAMVAQHESEQSAEAAMVTQREAELAVAEKTEERTHILSGQHAASIQELDEEMARRQEATAAVVAAKAQLQAFQSTIKAANYQVLGAQSNVAAIQASESQIQAQIDDTVLKAVRSGRVQYRIAQPGEVVGDGGKVLSMIDLSDVTITFFLPELSAGRVSIGSEVHIVLDATPDDVIPATVTFVESVAQFTPKSVETQSEREKLVFRVKARISPEILHKRASQIKSGVPGMAYVRLDPTLAWPTKLAVRSQQ